jgi:hypothetical protein
LTAYKIFFYTGVVASPYRTGREFEGTTPSTISPPDHLPQPHNLAQAFLIRDGKITREDLLPKKSHERRKHKTPGLNLRSGVFYVSDRNLGHITRKKSLQCEPPSEFDNDAPDLPEEELERLNQEPSEPDDTPTPDNIIIWTDIENLRQSHR